MANAVVPVAAVAVVGYLALREEQEGPVETFERVAGVSVGSDDDPDESPAEDDETDDEPASDDGLGGLIE